MRRLGLSLGLIVTLVGCTTYHHKETMDVEGNVLSWETNIKRTWGTSTAEFYTTMGSEKGSIGGAGISRNMSEVLGPAVPAQLMYGFTGRGQPPEPLVEEEVEE